MGRLNRKTELTHEKFSRFLERLSPESDRAGEEYERLRFRLCTFFASRQCRFADELADETINRVMLKASEERIESIVGYCYGVARNVYLESVRNERDHKDIDEVQIAADAPEENTALRECFDKCLCGLPLESRDALLDYFLEDRGAKIAMRRRIAQRMNITQEALRIQVMRDKQKLAICIKRCMGLEAVT